MSRCKNFHLRVGTLLVALALGSVATSEGQNLDSLKNRLLKGKRPITDFLSSGGGFALFGRGDAVQSPGEAKRGGHDHGRGGNTFVNDPCMDPPPEAPFPTNFQRTVQSETEIAVLNAPGSMGKKMVGGYNDSWGFYDNRQGLSGYAYSTNGGNTWIDGGGLPPRVPGGGTCSPATPGQDCYFGDPVVVVHQRTQTFYYSSLYLRPDGAFTLSVNRGRFQNAPEPAGLPTESTSNTRCANDPTEFGIPDPPNQDERIIWELPVEAVLPPFLGVGNTDFLDKEWLYVDQNTGTLYLTYTRFANDAIGSTPIELVRCIGCANNPTGPMVFTPPSVIVPNLLDTFNQATQPFTTPSGRLIVTWFARTFSLVTGAEVDQRIEYAFSDNDGVTFTAPLIVADVNPQGEPPGYNRGRLTILNAPYIFVDRGEDDGVFTSEEASRAGFGNVYITYFDGVTNLPQTVPPVSQLPAECRPPNVLSQTSCNPFARAARILLSTSRNNGTSFEAPVRVNDDATLTTHVFPSVQANKHGDVYVAWTDRRQDPNPFIPAIANPTPGGAPLRTAGGGNIFNDIYAAVSKNQARSFGHNRVQTKVSTSWFTRADAAPNFGDYNSAELLGFNQFVTTWADGRFPVGTFIDTRPAPFVARERLAATPDFIFTISQGLGVGGGGN